MPPSTSFRAGVRVDARRWDGFDLAALRAFVDGRIVDVASTGVVLDLGGGDVDTLPLGWTVVRLDGLLMVVPPYMADRLLVPETASGRV